MNKITSSLQSSFLPEKALIVYSQAAKVSYNFRNKYYLEWHEIANGKLLAGKPVDETFMQQLSKIVNHQAHKEEFLHLSGFIPDHVLHYSGTPKNYRICWWRPMEKRVMYFSKELGIPSGQVVVPPLIFIATSSALTVFSFVPKSKKSRPLINETLYQAPFHNVAQQGLVCIGNAVYEKPKKPDVKSLIEYWEHIFWNSEFTHQNNDAIAKVNINSIWKKLIEEKSNVFPLDILIKSRAKLNQLIK